MMKLGSVQTICPTHWKSYLVVTFPNSHVKLTKSVITSSLSPIKIICMYMYMHSMGCHIRPLFGLLDKKV